MYEWDERYCIGQPIIDAEHRKLFQLCARVVRIFQYEDEQRNQRAIAEAVKYLKNYTLEHFADEEAYQRSIGYEGFEEHRKKHEAFAQTILEQENIMEKSGYAPEAVEEFARIVNDWLFDHILNCDQAIKPGQ